MSLLRNNARGFTLVELLVSVGIFLLLMTGIVWLLVYSLRSNTVIWDQLSSQNDARRVLRLVVDDVRRAESSSIGSYPIVTSTPYELAVYTNVDADSVRERVRFWLDGTELKRGIIEPTGNPLVYDENQELVTVIGRDIVNIAESMPLFLYYGEGYAGTSTPLVDPVNLTDVRVVKVQLEIERDPLASPVPLSAESLVHIRNLKGD